MNVLVVDDEPSICWGLEELLTRQGFTVYTAGSAEKGLELAQQQSLDLVLLDVRLPGMSGIEALRSFQNATQQAPVIVMSAFGDLEVAIEVVRRGACDYLHKPFGLDDALAVCVKSARMKQSMEGISASYNGRAPSSDTRDLENRPQRLIGNSPAMQRVFRQIALVADSQLSVLITGETGTGKELVAAAIHQHSSRREKPYIPIAPVTFNTSLLESELFGHVRGAFTGALEDRSGLFEVACGGTILLDEIGDLPLSLQVKLLRVLEQRQYSRVGEIRVRPCDIRFLSATHHDLRAAVDTGSFRQDLIYRLSGAELRLPALRERPEDIGPLVTYFLEQIGYPDPSLVVSSELLDHLCSWHWPGNIRELRNAVERAAVLARGRPLDSSDFLLGDRPYREANSTETAMAVVLSWARELLLRRAQFNNRLERTSGFSPKLPLGSESLYEEYLSLVEPPLLKAVLESTGGNRSAAAEMLGMHRSTLRERLRRYQLE